MGKRIIVYIFLSVVFIQYLFSQENIDDYNEQSRQIVSNFLSSQNKEEKQKTLDALYQAISSDKIINKEKIPNLRLSIYVRIFLTIKNNHELSLDKRQELLNVLADGIVNEGIVRDNTLYLRERNVKFLYELVYERKIQDLTSLCVKNIEKACVQLLHDPRYAVLLLSVSGSKRANKLLQEFADSPRLNLERMYYSKTWAATLIFAQKGEEYFPPSALSESGYRSAP